MFSNLHNHILLAIVASTFGLTGVFFWERKVMEKKPQELQIEPGTGQEKATFAMGCFWGPDKFFSSLEGVTDVVVGYTGGEKEDPTYYNLGDHSEAVRIIYNPEQISYAELLSYFWGRHDPTADQKNQYRSAIFYHNEDQKKLAEDSKEEVQKNYDRELRSFIEPAKDFYPAEEYHQNYLEKQK